MHGLPASGAAVEDPMGFLQRVLARCAEDCERNATAAREGSPRWTAEKCRALAYRDAADRAGELRRDKP